MTFVIVQSVIDALLIGAYAFHTHRITWRRFR
jgi:hypothetical protein